MPLPISVIIPTRNCRESLERHLDAVGEWLRDVAEVIAIDSESTDGTLELLRARLSCIGATIMSYPPGLYESWNSAIDVATAPWTYISTVGDTIDRDGLGVLQSTADSFNADVVVSPPRMVGQDGATPAGTRWPIHHFCEALGETETPLLLSKLETVIAVCSYGSGSILGSSAANIYRTAVLQEYPFPLEFGHAGDTAWALRNCARIRLVILPRAISTFCVGWQLDEWDPHDERELLLRLNREASSALEAAREEPDLRLGLAWLRALAANEAALWNWLADQADLLESLRHRLQQVNDEKARTLLARVVGLIRR